MSESQHVPIKRPSDSDLKRPVVDGSMSNIASDSHLLIANDASQQENVLDAINTLLHEPEVKISQTKKWALLGIFSLGFFIDIWMYAAFFVFTGTISQDFDIPFPQQTWVINSYGVTFGAFLLFWGRVSDLYSAKPVFVFGFLALGALSLIISFLPDRYSFFVLRAAAGIAGATVIPASYRLMAAVFEPHELGKAFTIYGLFGPVANSTGAIFAGILQFIPTGGQGAPWRWFFRILAILIIPTAIGSYYWIPKPKGQIADAQDKFRRLDLFGCSLILAAIVLFVLGLTLGASYGFKTAGFLAPFLLSAPIFAGFFVWESRIPEEYALIPPSTWRILNFTPLIILALYIYSWWYSNFLVLIEIYIDVHHESPLLAATRLLPEPVAAGFVSVLLAVKPSLASRPRIPIVFGLTICIVSYVLFAQSGTQIGNDYWRYLFPGLLLGSGCMMAVFTGTNVGIMTSVPTEMAGVAGAVLQVSLQLGAAAALSIQAGLMTVEEGGIANFHNPRTSFYFMIGWGTVWLLGFISWYRTPKIARDEEKATDLAVMAH